jgi:hypothetical protein
MHTQLDKEIVSWIGGVGPAGVSHVMDRFGRARSWAFRRLGGLVGSGLLTHRMLLHNRPGLYLATTRGLRWCELERVGVPRLGPGGYEHAWQVASAAVALQVGLPDWEIIGERTLRTREIDERELLASVAIGERPSGRRMLHKPDLALISPQGGVWAVEVELSRKSRSDLQKICRAFARARHLQGVIYLAAPIPQRAVRTALTDVRAEDRITVMALEQASSLAEALRTGGLR